MFRLAPRAFLHALRSGALIALLATAGMAVGQDTAPERRPHQLVWKQWTVSDGLPQITVNDLLQDRDDYLWVATQDGVARFDGVRFRNYELAYEPGMGHLVITALALDRAGSLWMGSLNGVSRFAGEHVAEVGPGVETGAVSQMRVHPDGSMWIAANKGLFVARGELLTQIDLGVQDMTVVATVQPPAGPPVAIGHFERVIDPLGERRREAYPDGIAPVVTTAVARDGGLWLGTQAGVYRADDAGAVQGPVIAPELKVGHMVEGADGMLWLATDRGLWRVAASGPAEQVVVPGIDETAWVRRVMFDREGNLWVGTQLTGLHMAWPDRFRRLDGNDGLVDGAVWSVVAAPDGEIFAGAPDGLYRGGLQGFRKAYGAAQLPHPTVIASLRDREGGLWIGTVGGLAYVPPGGTEPVAVPGMPTKGWIAALAEDTNGDVLVGGVDGLYRVHDGLAQLIPLPGRAEGVGVTGLARDHHGRWWVGYESGLAYLDRSTWEARPMAQGSTEGVMLAPFGDGVLANMMTGLLYIDPTRAVTVGRAQGLHTEAIHSVITDDRYVWMQTPNGVGRLVASELQDVIDGKRARLDPRVLGDRGASQIAECNGGQQTAGLITEGRWLWCPSLQGLLVLDTSLVDTLAPPPPSRVEALVTSQRRITGDTPIVLAPDERDVEIHFTGMQFRDADRLTFRTRLRGYSDEWQELGSRRVAYYTNLTPGDYVFDVQTSNADGVTGPVDSRAFSLEPSWHQTAVARGAALLATLLLAWAIVQLRLRSLNRQRKALEENVRLRTAQLEEANRRLAETSRTDTLTGLHNRRFLLEQMPHEIARVARRRLVESDNGNVMAILHVDLDHFKQVNDTYGHHVGDQVLAAVATVLRETTRDADFVTRWGGEEFVIVARDVDRRGAATSAQRVVQAIRSHIFKTDSSALRVTCSVGYAMHPQPNSEAGWESTLALADAATYLAKRAGRDRAVGIECEHGDAGDDFYARLHRNPQGLADDGLIRILPVDH